jgi:hypothetical protein
MNIFTLIHPIKRMVAIGGAEEKIFTIWLETKLS